MKKFAAVFILTVAVFVAKAQLSNKGKEFWVGYGHHQFMETGGTNGQEMVLYLSAEEAAIVTVTIDSSGDGTAFKPNWSRTYNIPANTVISTGTAGSPYITSWTGVGSTPPTTIPKGGFYDARLYSKDPMIDPTGNGGEGVFTNKGIHITSNVPIVAYAHIYGSASSGATMLMPVETWGYSYTAMNSRQYYQGSGGNCFSWMYVIAQHDNTVIQITPSVPSRLGKPAGSPFTVTLQKGWIYQYIGASKADKDSGYEVTGTMVKSIVNNEGNCYPIAAFSGSSRTTNPGVCVGGTGGGDNDMQQVFPQQAWGKKFLTAPLSGGNGITAFMTNMYKIVVTDASTIVKRNGVALTPTVTEGGQIYYYFESKTGDYIEADKPIMMAQFMSGSSVCNAGPSTGNSYGDPEMIYISPLEQGITRIGFYRNTVENIILNGLTMIVPTGAVASVKIDGAPLAATGSVYTAPHPQNAAYTIVQKQWTAARAQCIVTCDSAFTAVTYGLGGVESYGYNAGTMINHLYGSLVLHNKANTTTATNEYTCKNTGFELAIQIGAYRPTKIVWHLSQLNDITPNADVEILNPLPSDSVFQYGSWNYIYRLPGTYQFTNAGSYSVPVSLTSPLIENCSNTDDMKLPVMVKEPPKAIFTVVHNGCVKDSVQFSSPATSANGYNIQQWLWTFRDGSTDSVQQPHHLFHTEGTKNITLQVITREGCMNDTVQPITVFAPPSAVVTASASAVCSGDSAAFISAATYQGTAAIVSWYWQSGNGEEVLFTSNQPYRAAYSAGSYTVKQVVGISKACVSDTVSTNIQVWPLPKAVFTVDEAVCIEEAVTIADASIVEGAVINQWQWSFDKGAAITYSDGNIFSYNFAAAGKHTIQHTVTDSRHCTAEPVEHTVEVVNKPVAAFSLPGNICMPGEAVFTNQSVTDNATTSQWHWNMGDGATVTTKDAHHTYNQAGNYTVSLEVSSAAGCSSNTSQIVAFDAFHARPVAAFAITPPAVCQGKEQTFTDNSIASPATITGWLWNFADGTTSVQRNPVKKYGSTGKYQVSLTVTDALGCTSGNTVKEATVYIQPVINAGGSLSVPVGKTIVLNATAEQADKIQFAWSPSAELLNANTLNPTLTVTHNQVYTLTATSTEGGCTTTDDLVIKALKTLVVPNIFTPNNDGINDKWAIEGLAEYTQCLVQVFNRYGQLVYASKGYGSPWDGRSNNKMLTAGTYYYIITDKGSDWQRITGSVTIIR